MPPGEADRQTAGLRVPPGQAYRQTEGLQLPPGQADRQTAGLRVPPGQADRMTAGLQVPPIAAAGKRERGSKYPWVRLIGLIMVRLIDKHRGSECRRVRLTDRRFSGPSSPGSDLQARSDHAADTSVLPPHPLTLTCCTATQGLTFRKELNEHNRYVATCEEPPRAPWPQRYFWIWIIIGLLACCIFVALHW